VSFYKSEDDFFREIDALQAHKAGPGEYLHLMRGLLIQYTIIKQMEKDTRGTEREKDFRFPPDVSLRFSPCCVLNIGLTDFSSPL
jgi:hypothetical protein